MLCCLLALALAGPFALWAAPASKKACCASRRGWLLAAAMGISILAAGAGSYLLLQPAPFRHICQFLGGARS